MKKRERRRVKESFTLIELLIVIGIIAILASMLLPALNSARKKAQDISCRGNLKQQGAALLIYAQDYKEFLPTANKGAYTEDPYAKSVYTGSYNTYLWSGRYVGLGALYSNKQLPSLKITFCNYIRQLQAGDYAVGFWDSNYTYTYTGGMECYYGALRQAWPRLRLTANPGVYLSRCSVLGTKSILANHVPGKNNVLYLDSHVESRKYRPATYHWRSWDNIDYTNFTPF